MMTKQFSVGIIFRVRLKLLYFLNDNLELYHFIDASISSDTLLIRKDWAQLASNATTQRS